MEVNSGIGRDAMSSLKSAVFVTMQDHWQYTELACQTFEAHTPEDVELHLIDDCSSDDQSKRWLSSLDENPRWCVWRHTVPKGLTYGWNQALEYCLTQELDYVGLMNNDIAVGPNWYPALLRSFHEDPRAGIVGPLTNHPGYQTLQDVIAADSPSPLSMQLSPQEVAQHTIVDDLCRRLQDLCASSGRYAYELPYTNGFMFLLRGPAVREVGLFDPKNRNLGNEDEYQKRMKARGWKSYCSLETFAWHAKDVSVARGWKSTPYRLIPRLPPVSKHSLPLGQDCVSSPAVSPRVVQERMSCCVNCTCCKAIEDRRVHCQAASQWVSLYSGRCRLRRWLTDSSSEKIRSSSGVGAKRGEVEKIANASDLKIQTNRGVRLSNVEVYSFATLGSAHSLLESYLRPSVERIGWRVFNMADGGGQVEFGQNGWYELMQLKAQAMLDAVDANLGRTIIWIDSDALVVKSFDPEHLLGDADLAAQQDCEDLCTGAMVIRCNNKTRDVFYETVNAKEFYQPSPKGTADQRAFNHVQRGRLDIKRIDTQKFWTPGSRDLSKGWARLHHIDQLKVNQIPENSLVVHANWCIGFEIKRRVLDLARQRFHVDFAQA